MNQPDTRILFITLSNIGDAVMTTPVLERLHELHPDAVIDIVTDRRSSEIFTHCPYRGEIIHKTKGSGLRGLLGLVRRLRRCRYDLVVDLRTDGLAWLLRAGRRLTKAHRNPRGPHAVEDLISVLDRIDSARRIPPARVWLSENERAWAKTRLAALPAGRHLAMGPGANWEPKIWPLDHFRSLLDKVADRFEGVLILGGPGDRERATLLARDLPLPALNLTGETTLLQAAALLEHCSLFVGNDSGLGHMAAAVETPTITVFGPGQPERYHPWSPCAHWLRGPEDRLELLAPDTVAATLLEHLG